MFRILLLTLTIVLSSHILPAQEPDAKKNELHKQEPTDQPTVPGQRFAKKSWSEAHKNNVERARQGDIDLAFFGDSLTARWNLYPDLVKAKFGKYKTAILGIGGDQTQDLLWRLQNGELDGFQPKVVVLLIGANNMSQKLKYTPEQIAKGVQANIAEIRKRAPNAKVLLVSIPTRNVPLDDWLNVKNADTNKELQKQANGNDVIYVDIWNLFLKPDGTVDAAFYGDMTHFNDKGFERYADALLPFIDKGFQP